MWLFAIIIACASKKLQVETFEETWTTVHDSFPYEDFNGVDWQGVHDELLPQAKKTKSAEELRPVLRDMLSRLELSHYGIIPLEKYEVVTDNKTNNSSNSKNSLGDQLGWIGLQARWIDEQLVVTKSTGNAKENDIQTGWTIKEIGTTSITDVASVTEDSRERAFDIGYYTKSKFTGYAGNEIRILFEDYDGEVQEKNLTYTVGSSITSPPFGNLPSELILFSYEVLEEGPHLISFSSFLMPIREPMDEAFEKIAKENPPGVIIDLRGNPGGLIDLGVSLCGYVISEKDIDLGTQISRDGTLFLTIYPRPEHLQYDGPVAILIDELSASTSEVTAGGLQELERAMVFGQQSAGKALPSVIKELPNGDRLQYVILDLKKTSGSRYEGVGVIPDVTVPRTQEIYKTGIDPELTAAINWILEQSNQSESPENH
jgi:carboxyl-terminal processing protease